MVHDTAGYAEPLVERRFHDPVSIWVVTLTRPDGREAGSAMVSLDGRTLSMRQALDVAKTLVDTVAMYTEAGGRVEDEVPL